MCNLRSITAIAALVVLAVFLTGGTAGSQQIITVLVDSVYTDNFGSTHPTGMAVLPSGERALVDVDTKQVYIIDEREEPISVFDISSFSSNPQGITYIAPWNQLGIVDYNSKKIFILNLDGTLDDTFDISYKVSQPMGISFIPSLNQFAVSDRYHDEVFFFDTSGNYKSQFDTGACGSSAPYGISYNPDTKELAISDPGDDMVYLVDLSGTLQDSFYTGFVSPDSTGICYNPFTGNYDVVDGSRDEIFSMNADGILYFAFSTIPFGANSPTGITCIEPSNEWALTDAGSKRIYFVNSFGILQDTIDVSSFSPHPNGITYIAERELFAEVDYHENRLNFFDISGSLLKSISLTPDPFGLYLDAPTGICNVPGTEVFGITDISKDSVIFVDMKRPSRVHAQFSTLAFGGSRPEGIAFIPNANAYAVVDRDADEVFIVDFFGKLLARFDTNAIIHANDPLGIAYNPNENQIAILDVTDKQVYVLELPVLSRLRPTSTCAGDLDKDGDVDGLDLGIFSTDFGVVACTEEFPL